MTYDAIVIGGGPAGMSAAIKVKEKCRSAKVLLVDRNKKLGKKLYATGNGKCNIANSRLDLSSYHSDNEFFPYQIISTESFMDLTDFFGELGVSIYDDDGYLYPRSLQASTVVWALSDRIKMLKIDIHTSETVLSVEMCGEKYKVATEHSDYVAKTVIAAPGSAAAPKLGGTESVYNLLKDMNVKIIPPHPALCKLRCGENMADLAGVRAKGEVTLICNESIYDTESGEIQFTDGWLSGIAVFNLSMQCIDLLNENECPEIELALVPGMEEDEVLNYLREFVRYNPERRIDAMLNGIVNEKISGFIMKRLGLDSGSAFSLSDDELVRIAHEVKHMRFNITGNGTYDESQAACGGVDTRQMRADTMELEGHRGVYVAGEFADVTGKCGGYNIMWAVISGMRAGRSAGKRLTDDKNK